MLFNSYVFVFFFFPLCICGYFLLNRWRKYDLALVFLLGMSLWFYGYFNPSYLPIILLSILGNFGITQLMERVPKHRRLVMILGVLLNLGVLFYFKYYDFFICNVNRIFATDLALLNVVLPLGISFFTFQQISYVVDAYRGEVRRYGFLQYACFVAYFPQLIAGPIVTHDELIPQLMDEGRKRFDPDNFARGLYGFVLGLGKKVLLADVFGTVVNWGYGSLDSLDATNALLVTLAYTFQVYFDFSGYCDMAVGLGKMMNIDLPVNFDSPYKALTITEFWQRWHKTLTRFFTRYVYIPLGGNRRGTVRTHVNVMIVYLVSGIWHGANYTFILWGILHGLFSVFTRFHRRRAEAMHPVINWLVTFAFLNVSWIFFRADSIGDALKMLRAITGGEFGPVNGEIQVLLSLQEFHLLSEWVLSYDICNYLPGLFAGLYYGIAMLAVLGGRNVQERMRDFRCGPVTMLTTALLLVWCVMSLGSISTFLYFNF